MNRRTLLVPVAALSAAVLLAACSGSAATTAPGSTAATGPTAAATSAATPVAGTPAAPTPTANTPATTPVPGTTAAPSYSPDLVLASKFPTVIDGQPVTGVQTYLFIDVLRAFGTTDADLQTMSQKLNAVGVDFSRLSFGTATGTVDGETVQLQGLRTPDSDANKVIQNFAYISAAFGNNVETVPTMTQSNVGGKNVTIATDSSSGDVTTLYVTGDTLFILESITDSQTTKILQALP